MASNRSNNFMTYDKYFVPLIEQIKKELDAGERSPALSAEIGYSRALELKARFYHWRKLLNAHVENLMVQGLGVPAHLLERQAFAANIITRLSKNSVEGGDTILTFAYDSGEFAMSAFGIDKKFFLQDSGRLPRGERDAQLAEVMGKLSTTPRKSPGERSENSPPPAQIGTEFEGFILRAAGGAGEKDT
jgi:hypothetical protein